jgi:hypothetical protein
VETYDYKDKTYQEVEAKLLWSLSHYDGAMSGIALYDGQMYYARCHQSPYSRKPRYFWLYSLSSKELDREKQYQNYFRDYYGFHCDYEENGRTRKQGGPRLQKDLGLWLRLTSAIRGVFGMDDTPKPAYSTMMDWAGIKEGDHKVFEEREAVGYFQR